MRTAAACDRLYYVPHPSAPQFKEKTRPQKGRDESRGATLLGCRRSPLHSLKHSPLARLYACPKVYGRGSVDAYSAANTTDITFVRYTATFQVTAPRSIPLTAHHRASTVTRLSGGRLGSVLFLIFAFSIFNCALYSTKAAQYCQGLESTTVGVGSMMMGGDGCIVGSIGIGVVAGVGYRSSETFTMR